MITEYRETSGQVSGKASKSADKGFYAEIGGSIRSSQDRNLSKDAYEASRPQVREVSAVFANGTLVFA
ncbi:hypothetical protein [uncultured Halopseudomonas sp.]|uniref:hypothetical protein n=1 Tax=uncultured Halopseudomonas sp. TaxID=2901193 RepID=UPI0030ECE810|tara:strand:- start:8950 stop:9153 length:204 start_codon:yes stop_codon:yes gene_type:complete